MAVCMRYFTGPSPAGGGPRAQFGLADDASQQREGPDSDLWNVQPEGTSSPFAETSPQPTPVSYIFFFFLQKSVFCCGRGWLCCGSVGSPHVLFLLGKIS